MNWWHGRTNKRILKWCLILLAVASVFYLLGATKEYNPSREIQVQKADHETQQFDQVDELNQYSVLMLAQKSTDVGLQLYTAIAKTETDNILISPYSIYSLLAIVYTGTNSYTEVQTGDILKFGDFTQPDLLDALQKTYDYMERGNSRSNLTVVSGVFGGIITSKFKEKLGKFVGGVSWDVDFAKNYEKARNGINDWLQKKTGNSITAILKKGKVNRKTRLVLVNSAIFTGAMTKKFRPEGTIASTWHMTNKVSTEVKLMYQTGVFKYTFHKRLDSQIIEIPFVGGCFSMFVILPRKIEGIKLVEKDINVSDLKNIPEVLSATTVHVSLPRFSLVGDLDLVAVMQTLGLTDIFDYEKADLSGLDGVGQLHVSNIAHKTRVTIKEDTGSPSSFTSFPRDPSSGNAENFWADHPFMFYIRETKSGNIMFLARYKDPYRIPDS